jgi:hypothetical protein
MSDGEMISQVKSAGNVPVPRQLKHGAGRGGRQTGMASEESSHERFGLLVALAPAG